MRGEAPSDSPEDAGCGGVFWRDGGDRRSSPLGLVWAIEATECVAIGRAEFLEALQRRPQIAVQMLPVLVCRLRRADARVSE